MSGVPTDEATPFRGRISAASQAVALGKLSVQGNQTSKGRFKYYSPLPVKSVNTMTEMGAIMFEQAGFASPVAKRPRCESPEEEDVQVVCMDGMLGSPGQRELAASPSSHESGCDVYFGFTATGPIIRPEEGAASGDRPMLMMQVDDETPAPAPPPHCGLVPAAPSEPVVHVAVPGPLPAEPKAEAPEPKVEQADVAPAAKTAVKDGPAKDTNPASSPQQATAPAGPNRIAGANRKQKEGGIVVSFEPDNCHACGGGVSWDGDEILFCEGCDVAVHQSCYNIKKVPEGDWFCDACKELPPSKVKHSALCALCPVVGGAYKKVSPKEAQKGQQWAHITCVVWCPETYLDGNLVLGLQGRAIKERRKLQCNACKITGSLGTVQCREGRCMTAYHVLCARAAEGVRVLVNADRDDDAEIYCRKHKSKAPAPPKAL